MSKLSEKPQLRFSKAALRHCLTPLLTYRLEQLKNERPSSQSSTPSCAHATQK